MPTELTKVIREARKMRAFCDCGSAATVVKNGARICQRCFDIEGRTNNSDQKRQKVAGEGRETFAHQFPVRLKSYRP